MLALALAAAGVMAAPAGAYIYWDGSTAELDGSNQQPFTVPGGGPLAVDSSHMPGMLGTTRRVQMHATSRASTEGRKGYPTGKHLQP